MQKTSMIILQKEIGLIVKEIKLKVGNKKY